ncbi:MAG: LytTR family DNA-binding domain-containing protein [Lachnospiraceae bacterium]|nr:LytTR family DNA-binding domain-containing protein [Lachnospiraceae bacterium]
MYFAIVDDLKSDRDHLISLLKEYGAAHQEVMTFSAYDSSESFLDDFCPGKFSAIFLDILMGETSGIEAARKIREKDAHISIIFTTTEKSFALDSYDVHALDFLVKPIRAERLSWCLKELVDTAAIPLYIKIKKAGSSEGDTSSALQLLPLEDILYAEAIHNGVLIHTPDGDIRTAYTLSELMRLLPETGQFFICGRGMMINFTHVEKIMEDGKIFLSDNAVVYCSRRKTKETLLAYANYQFLLLRRGKERP